MPTDARCLRVGADATGTKPAGTVVPIREPHLMSRLSKYHPGVPEQTTRLMLLGATEAEVAAFYGIGLTTFEDWKHRYRALRRAVEEGAIVADANVASSLYKRANGYDYVERRTTYGAQRADGTRSIVEMVETTKHMPGDVHAQTKWLHNRAVRWRRPEAFDLNVKEDKLLPYTREEAVMRLLQEAPPELLRRALGDPPMIEITPERPETGEEP